MEQGLVYLEEHIAGFLKGEIRMLGQVFENSSTMSVILVPHMPNNYVRHIKNPIKEMDLPD
jgi:hypothetical protein